MKLTRHEQNLIEATRHGAKDENSDLTITLSFTGPGVRVRWESHGIHGDGAGASLDDAYEQAWQDRLQKVGRIISAENSEPESDPGSTELH
jgi:hypothetical protein